MQYRVQITVEPVSGIRYFGYPIYAEVKLDGISKDTHTIKNASPSQWTSSLVYTTPWLTAAGKTSGTTALAIRLYSGMGSSRTETYNYSVAVSPAAAKLAAGNGTIGGDVSISVTRYSNSFTHTVTYVCGAASGTIASKTTAGGITWSVPLVLANQIPNATSGGVCADVYHIQRQHSCWQLNGYNYTVCTDVNCTDYIGHYTIGNGRGDC